MAKKEFPDKDLLNKEIADLETGFTPEPAGFSEKLAAFGGKAFGVIKFILGICLLPFVYSASFAFLNEFGVIKKPLADYFWTGVISQIMIYLFIWEPAVVYKKGHKLLEVVFNFFKPLVRVAPYLLPIYTIVVFLLYEALSFAIASAWLLEYTLFLLGFSLSLHLVFSAKTIRGRKGDFLKGNYIFGFSFVYILNVGLLALFLSLIFTKFSFVNFCNNSLQSAKGIFEAVFRQLFAV